jgi:hypothetical protein
MPDEKIIQCHGHRRLRISNEGTDGTLSITIDMGPGKREIAHMLLQPEESVKLEQAVSFFNHLSLTPKTETI